MTIHCNCCGSRFEPGFINQRFCSDNCRNFFYSHSEEKGEMDRCRCGKYFLTTQGTEGYCCAECKEKFQFVPLF